MPALAELLRRAIALLLIAPLAAAMPRADPFAGAQAGLDSTCRLVQADFHHMPFSDGTFDHCYSIEACCHSPDRADVYAEVYRCLKPGGYFISYEWCLTEKHDPSNPKHVTAKKKIEEGDGLPDICYTTACDAALKKVAKVAKQKQFRLNKMGRASESDRHIHIKKPKHLFSGKRGIGKTDRR